MEVSKMVVDREKSATKVIAAARTHKSKASSGMAALLGADYKQAAEQLMDTSAQKLDSAVKAMVAACHLIGRQHVQSGDDPFPSDLGRGEARAAFLRSRVPASLWRQVWRTGRLSGTGAAFFPPVSCQRVFGRLDGCGQAPACRRGCAPFPSTY